MEYQFKIEEETNKRIDVFLTEKIKISRTKIQNLIKKNNLMINDKIITKSNYKLSNGEIINFKYEKKKINQGIEGEDIPLDIIYEDEYFLVINKDVGIITHPTSTIKTGTLINALLYKKKLPDIKVKDDEEFYRPGIVHRLDKDTSGAIIIAKNEDVQTKFSDLFKTRNIQKTYLAVVYGSFKYETGTITFPIGRHRLNRKIMSVRTNGKPCITDFKLLKKNNNYSLLELDLKTGRTHQIRVHLKHLGYPIVGDVLYSTQKSKKEKLMLHSHTLKFIHPITKKDVFITAPLKATFLNFLKENYLNYLKN